ncbi:MAG: hypothetical protein K1X35_12700 [Caulobacteraceae bacterium]|nr:hypothetical protein [Caulobacteraceae bacterium]
MPAEWSVRFDKWLPEAPRDGRSPWVYLDELDESDCFPTASDCAFSIYERRVRDPYQDGYTPLFRPARRDRRH